MRLTTRVFALALAGALLAGCGHKDKNAPLAFVPADTPYVAANLKPISDDARQAMLAQADLQLPAQLAQINDAADRVASQNPAAARLLHALAASFKGNTVEGFAHDAGVDLKGRFAFYGLGLSPVLRLELSDPKAFDGFVTRFETAYGKPFGNASMGGQSYRKAVSAETHTELVIATVDKQGVIALLPADVSPSMLREALGLDRPPHSLQDSDALADLAKAKGYQPWLIGKLDVQRLLPLIASGKDPLFTTLFTAGAERESAKTGEPLANLTKIPPSCPADAARIAARVPQLSFGYTRLDARHQDSRLDVSLASDITQAFDGLKVELPGLGEDASAPFDLSLALPMLEVRGFWQAQADAVAAKPFACPALADLNAGFGKLGLILQKAATPPLGDLIGLHLALDEFSFAPGAPLPKISGRLLLATRNPAGLLGMGQMALPALGQVRVPNTGVPAPLPANLTTALGEPAWAAMNDHALAVAVGAGEDGKLASMLNAPVGDAGRLMRMHFNGDMYVAWIKAMAQKIDAMADQQAAMAAQGAQPGTVTPDRMAGLKARFAALEVQAAHVDSASAEVHMDSQGLVISNHLTLK
ncbi:hypothetical protein CS053_05035 [Rhodanobacter glycinis]|uniref:DUF3352 domain-containing protein n=1 Tax=Rhodanobacter glycinis TaxID=582702 RepID=A0A5B9DYW8_9GAMM|nr:hypothetical protein [Rhodanobacter glycinis]QEE23935.1 hypothetical protein CS053_05035 [Rhodanobacter glycinis]